MLLLFWFYLFGLILVQSLADSLAEDGSNISEATKDGIMDHFGSVQAAMLSFFKSSTNGEQWGVYFALVEPTGTVNSGLFLFFISMIHVSLLNILSAVFVDLVVNTSEPDREIQASEKQLRARREAEEVKSL